MAQFRGIHSGFLIALFIWMAAAPVGGAVSVIYWADRGAMEPFPEGPDIYFGSHHISRFDLATGANTKLRLTGPYTAPTMLVLDHQARTAHFSTSRDSFLNEPRP